MSIMTDAQIKTAYEKFRRGDAITDQEIQGMLRAIVDAMAFLTASPDFALCRRQAIQDRHALEGFLESRKRKP